MVCSANTADEEDDFLSDSGVSCVEDDAVHVKVSAMVIAVTA